MRRESGLRGVLLSGVAVSLAVFSAACSQQSAVKIEGSPASPSLGNEFTAVCSDFTEGLGLTDNSVRLNLNEQKCAEVTLCLDPNFKNGLTPQTYVPAIDLVFLIDETGSMSQEIAKVKSNLNALVTNFGALTPDLRLGVVSYKDFPNNVAPTGGGHAGWGGDINDFPFKLVSPLTNDVGAIQTALNSLVANGGGDTQESISAAIKAMVTGEGFAPYFNTSDIGWRDASTGRLRIIVGVADAPDKRAGVIPGSNPVRNYLPQGAADFTEATNLLKSQGILFVGIGNAQPYTQSLSPASVMASAYSDFNHFATETGALVKDGIDLNGNGTLDDGDIAPNGPAVLKMEANGDIKGAAAGSDPTTVLADALYSMIEQTLPFRVHMSTSASGRVAAPTDQELTVPIDATSNSCFQVVTLSAGPTPFAACSVNRYVDFRMRELTNDVDVDLGFVVKSYNEVACTPTP